MVVRIRLPGSRVTPSLLLPSAEDSCDFGVVSCDIVVDAEQSKVSIPVDCGKHAADLLKSHHAFEH